MINLLDSANNQIAKHSNVLKIDLDLNTEFEVVKLLKDRLKQLNYLEILPFEYIDRIELIYKSSFSVKIYLNKSTYNLKIMILQSMLGNDWRKTAIEYRDLVIENREHWNKMFDIKRYPTGEFRKGVKKDITKEVAWT